MGMPSPSASAARRSAAATRRGPPTPPPHWGGGAGGGARGHIDFGHAAYKGIGMKRSRPPFRADHVGSLLRPQRLKEYRAKRERTDIGAQQFKAVEDECIRAVIKQQEEVG